MAAATFYTTGHQDVADIMDAHHLLTPLLGSSLASIIFAVALLASGQSSTLTGTLAGQIVMEGFLHIQKKPWIRRLITRTIAVIPAFLVTLVYGEKGTAQLLVLSQVILSMQLGFAIVPLIQFTSNKTKMGQFKNSKLLSSTSIIIASIIILLNLYLLYKTFV